MADDPHAATSLGASGLKVTKLWLGTMMFGDQTDEAEAGRIVAAARDAGVNAIDTADAYADGESERIIGRLDRRRPRPLGARDQARQPDRPGPERSRPVARPHDPRARRAAWRASAPTASTSSTCTRKTRRRRSRRRSRAMQHLLASGKVHYFGALQLSRLAHRAHGRDVPRRRHRSRRSCASRRTTR